jgi:tetratricopeptide (TPR) repeat protein
MHSTAEIIGGVLTILVAAALVIGFVWMTIKRADDPARVAFKWVLTVPALGLLFGVAAPMVAKGGMSGAFGGVPLTAVSGLMLAVIWMENLSGLVAKPFTNLFDGGSAALEPHPMYSVAESCAKRGKYREAIAEIRKQLDRFPTDVQGQMFLAEIQAQHLNDLQGAEVTLKRLCAQPGHAPANIAFALYTLADWHLKYGQDPESARAALEQVIAQLPDTEHSLAASQRIAHLGNMEMHLGHHEKKFIVPKGPKNRGLMQSPPEIKPAEINPEELIAQHLSHLETHPLDMEVRGELARLYGEVGRLDLAREHLEQIINHPQQNARAAAHWLNLLADLQVRAGEDYESIKQTLDRIIECAPGSALAGTALTRISHLRLELKSLEKTTMVKMGTYEQRLGLKMKERHHPSDSN